MRHSCLFYSSVQLTALTALAAANDPVNSVNGNNVQVRTDVPFIGGVTNIYNGTSFTQAQITAPSLLAQVPHDSSGLIKAAVVPSTGVYEDLFDIPAALKGGEYMNYLQNGGAGGAVAGVGIVELVDGPPKPSSGKIFTVRATGAATLVIGTWVNTALTLGSQLPAANYDLVGFRAEGANLHYARLVFNAQVPRPGCPANPNPASPDNQRFRKGGLGVWGSFTNQTLPTVDCTGLTDTAQVFYLDLIQK